MPGLLAQKGSGSRENSNQEAVQSWLQPLLPRQACVVRKGVLAASLTIAHGMPFRGHLQRQN